MVDKFWLNHAFVIDICKTVGALFDIPTPYAKGNVMKELFE